MTAPEEAMTAEDIMTDLAVETTPTEMTTAPAVVEMAGDADKLHTSSFDHKGGLSLTGYLFYF